jgi:hypothetical protein
LREEIGDLRSCAQLQASSSRVCLGGLPSCLEQGCGKPLTDCEIPACVVGHGFGEALA